MCSITIHAVDSELNARLSAEAKREKKSKNQLIKDLLSRSIGLPSDKSFADELARHEAVLLSPIVIGELYGARAPAPESGRAFFGYRRPAGLRAVGESVDGVVADGNLPEIAGENLPVFVQKKVRYLW